MSSTVMIVRSGGKAFIGRASEEGTCDKLDDVCEIIAFMSPRGNNLSKQALITGVDYSSRPLKHMEFTGVDNFYDSDDIPNEKERAQLIGDYERFCNQEFTNKILAPSPADIIATNK